MKTVILSETVEYEIEYEYEVAALPPEWEDMDVASRAEWLEDNGYLLERYEQPGEGRFWSAEERED